MSAQITANRIKARGISLAVKTTPFTTFDMDWYPRQTREHGGNVAQIGSVDLGLWGVCFSIPHFAARSMGHPDTQVFQILQTRYW
jgi:hypothetical protein